MFENGVFFGDLRMPVQGVDWCVQCTSHCFRQMSHQPSRGSAVWSSSSLPKRSKDGRRSTDGLLMEEVEERVRWWDFFLLEWLGDLSPVEFWLAVELLRVDDEVMLVSLPLAVVFRWDDAKPESKSGKMSSRLSFQSRRPMIIVVVVIDERQGDIMWNPNEKSSGGVLIFVFGLCWNPQSDNMTSWSGRLASYIYIYINPMSLSFRATPPWVLPSSRMAKDKKAKESKIRGKTDACGCQRPTCAGGGNGGVEKQTGTAYRPPTHPPRPAGVHDVVWKL